MAKLSTTTGRCLVALGPIGRRQWQASLTSFCYLGRIPLAATALRYFRLRSESRRFSLNSSLTPTSAINLVVKIIKPVLKGQVSDVEVKLEAERKWVEKVQGALKLRVYADDCDTVMMPS